MEVANTRDFQWKTLAPLPSRRVYSTLVEVGGQVFAIGGCDDNGVPMDCFEVYSPEADQWTSLPPMPTARAGVAVATLGKRIMVIGGVGANQAPLKIVEMYNVDEGKWKKRNSLREAAMGISVTAKGKQGAGGLVSPLCVGYKCFLGSAVGLDCSSTSSSLLTEAEPYVVVIFHQWTILGCQKQMRAAVRSAQELQGLRLGCVSGSSNLQG